VSPPATLGLYLKAIMQGYVQDAKFSRGKKEILAFASLVFVGRIDLLGSLGARFAAIDHAKRAQGVSGQDKAR